MCNFDLTKEEKKELRKKTLTKTEKEVIHHIKNGVVKREDIANKMFIAMSTIKEHLNHIMKKLSVSSMPELVYVVLTKDCVGE
jgi:DNA-binding NarL/FixJ family response regulator